MVNLKSFDLTQKYLRSLNEKFGYDLYSMVKIKVGQSDGSMILCSCGSVDYKPNWSHIVDRVEILTIDDDSNEQTKEPVILNEGGGKDIGEEAILGRFSCTPVDIGYRHMDNCCRNDSDPEPDLFNTHPGYFYHEHGPSTPPPEGAFWSDNTYKFTHSLINGCAPDPTLNQYNHGYGNTIFSFENELDNNFGGLDPAEFPKCIQYVPPYDKEFFENEENEDAKPAEMGRHLAHHYMQAYFCFSLAVSDAEEGVFHSKYGTPQLTKLPFGMSNFALGILVARGIYEDGGKTEAACLEAIKFSNRFFGEYAKARLVKKGMTRAYPGATTGEPWPDNNIYAWKYDFGYAVEGETNKVAKFNAYFLGTIFDYIATYPEHFNGLLIHYYSHWSCIGDILGALRRWRMDNLGTINSLPLIIEELGNIQRLLPYGEDQPGYKCDKTIEYVTGDRGNEVASSELFLNQTQAAETARKLLMFFGKSQIANVKMLMWEWLIKPIDYASEKTGLIQACGYNPTLPGYRYPAFTAFRFFSFILAQGFEFAEFSIETDPNAENLQMVKVDFLRTNGVDEYITAFWGYDTNNYYREDPGIRIVPLTPPGSHNAPQLYDATGQTIPESAVKIPEIGNNVQVEIDTAPRYMIWENNLFAGWEPSETGFFENYNQFILGRQKNSVDTLWSYSFDTGEENSEKFDGPGLEYNEYELDAVTGFAWTNSGLLIVNNSPTETEKGIPTVHFFNSFTGELEAQAVVIKIAGEDEDIELLRGVVSKQVEVGDKAEDRIFLPAKIEGSDNYCLYGCEKTGSTLTVEIEINLDEHIPDQIRLAENGTILLSSTTSDGAYILAIKADYSGFDIVAQVDEPGIVFNGFEYMESMGERIVVGCTGTFTGLICFKKRELGPGMEEEHRKDFSGYSSGEPVGLRKSPYGTVMVMVYDGIVRKLLELGWFIRNANFEPDFRREIALTSSERDSITSRDFIPTWERVGVRESILRVYLKSFEIIEDELECFIWAENTSNDKTSTGEYYLVERILSIEDPDGQVTTIRSDLQEPVTIRAGDDIDIDEILWAFQILGIYKIQVIYISEKEGQKSTAARINFKIDTGTKKM